MKIVGLTGSIGMGKSTTAAMIERVGIPVFCSDSVVRALQAKDGRALPALAAVFPDVIKDGILNREQLGRMVFADAEAKKKLEAIMHPMVAEERAHFFKEAEEKKVPFVVLDIPLLFETGAEKACDKIIVASAPSEVQKARVLARPGMTEDKFKDILSHQMSDAEKRSKADYIVYTNEGLATAEAQVQTIVKELRDEFDVA